MFAPSTKYSVSAVWWFWFPLLFFPVFAGINIISSAETRTFLYSENGILEIAQFFLLMAGVIVAGWSLLSLKNLPHLTKVWLVLAIAGCLYTGLEEISYGQHLGGWGTPEYWANINDQQETNLHNASSWLDQKPRLLLQFGIIFGGIVIPFLRRKAPQVLPQKFKTIYPEDAMFYTAVMVILAHVCEYLKDWGGIVVFQRASEVQEFYFYYFVLVYLVMLRKRLAA